jgi:hypothetical protein
MRKKKQPTRNSVRIAAAIIFTTWVIPGKLGNSWLMTENRTQMYMILDARIVNTSSIIKELYEKGI